MPIAYLFSVDSLVHRLTQHRIWAAVALCGLWYLLALTNRIAKLPTSPLPPLGPNDVAIVTGGLSGLGLEMVKMLLQKHRLLRVFVLDITEPEPGLGDAVLFLRCDLASWQAVDAALSQISARCKALGRPVSVVINNAGVRLDGCLLAMARESIQRDFTVNTFAPVSILQRVVSEHVATHAHRRLSIVTVSSVLAALGPRNLLSYSASKAAATQFHEVLSRELAELPSVRMLLVMPGQLTTQMFSDLEPSRRFVAPLVDHRALAESILEKVELGEEGVMCEPFYANFGYLIKALPWKLQQMARDFSQMDEKIKP
ncbi:NAD(P)-binding protein [Metschnikowia bicuspidata var. bicuspidata NRRL YB-4993]|uniref:NAD(P)-binding protein n=1 Tax=Metschnikowia bicuspidata var. bicuspidata NRRL YB-4993 TaxID=869754 RepID=A0A1A0HEI3_9ASCO|nr:NAD(P)-binding protein [Metschnikowia bicuspidata var. bicuspidata NRRL YB-4993]OBA22313.1 NAD(P)-binding protein [Metschnikowia bicuspidata var. bicuspidata NRRL YB-4993]